MTTKAPDPGIVCDRFIGLTMKVSDAMDRAVALHNECEALQGYPPATTQELAAVLADYLLWKFGEEGRAAFERQAKHFALCAIEKYIRPAS